MPVAVSVDVFAPGSAAVTVPVGVAVAESVLVTGAVVDAGDDPAGGSKVVAWNAVMLADAPLSTCMRRPHCPLASALFVTVIVQALGSAALAAQALA